MRAHKKPHHLSQVAVFVVSLCAGSVGFAGHGGGGMGGGGFHQGGGGGFHGNNGYHPNDNNHFNNNFNNNNHINNGYNNAYDHGYNHNGYNYYGGVGGDYYPEEDTLAPSVILNQDSDDSQCQTTQCNENGTCVVETQNCDD